MAKSTRRDFIKKSGFTLLTVGVSGKAFFRHTNMAANSALTAAAALSTTDNILVVIQLSGGNDGINTVIPMSGPLNSTYRQRRPTLAVPQDQILRIGVDAKGNELGFHPNMPKLQAMFGQGKMGVIQSVGYPNPNRSHFESMDIWHSADPTRKEREGWLGEYFDVSTPSPDNPLVGVYIGGTVPLSLRGETVTVPAIGNVATYQFQADPRYADPASTRTDLKGEYSNRVNTFLALNPEAASERALYEQVRQTALEAYDGSVDLQEGIHSYVPDPNIVYPNNNGLARALQQVAQIIAGGLGTKILYVNLGGFDTHQGQNGNNGQGGHPQLMQYLNDAVDAFYRDMVRLNMDDKVLIMSWSEFGRKVPENGNIGTDHGTTSPQFVFGTNVKGGIFGEHPSLTDLNPGTEDPKFGPESIDFRSIYATVLEGWLGVESRDILGGDYPLLGFI